MNNEKIIGWAVMKDGECLSVRRFEPVASGEAEGVEFVPLVRLAEQPAQHVLEVRVWRDKNHDQHAEFRGYDKLPDGEHVFYTSPQPAQQEPVANYCKECLTYNGHHEGCSHHTSPPAQRKPLTDMQVDGEWILVRDLDTNDVEKSRLFARAIEAAHGIKGDA